MRWLVATDLDGTFDPQSDATICISGRTWAEYDDLAKLVASRMPLYIRGEGSHGDRDDAARFKAMMINWLGVRRFYEDDPYQASIIERELDHPCEVVVVGAK